MIEVAKANEVEWQATMVAAPNELIVSPHRDMLGLHDVPLVVQYAEDGDLRRYRAIFEDIILPSSVFIEFLNDDAPHHQYQSAAAIAGDWIYGTPEFSREQIAKDHSKIPVWPAFTRRARAYTDLAVNADKPGINPQEFEDFCKQVIEPQPLSVIKAKIRAQKAEQIKSRFEPADIASVEFTKEDLKKLADAAHLPTSLLLSRVQKLGIQNGTEVFLYVISRGRLYKDAAEAKKAIKQFSKLPFAKRQQLQEEYISLLSSGGMRLSERHAPTDEVLDLLAEKQMQKDAIVRCTDATGQEAFVRYPSHLPSWALPAVPLDYRDLAEPSMGWSQQNDYRWPVAQVKLRPPYRLQEPRVERLAAGRLEKVKEQRIIPMISWTTDNKGYRTMVDIIHTEELPNTDIPTYQTTDSLLGMIILRHLERHVDLPKTRSLTFNGEVRIQAMGAAQLPLLALMYQKRIMDTSLFLPAIEAAIKK